MARNKAVIFMISAALALSGCSAMSTLIGKRNLDVKTQMSDTVWLDPTPAYEHTVFVQVRNATDKKIELTSELKHKLKEKGYKITSNPSKAHYWLQVNILKLDKMDLRKAKAMFNSGYGSAIGGAAVGALATATTTSNTSSIVSGGLIGGAISYVADALVEDNEYVLMTDVQVTEKTNKKVSTTETANIKNGSSSYMSTSLKSSDHKRRYQTRIMSTANKANLDFKEAEPALANSLSTSLAGIF